MEKNVKLKNAVTHTGGGKVIENPDIFVRGHRLMQSIYIYGRLCYALRYFGWWLQGY
jgi:hypothetical protein